MAADDTNYYELLGLAIDADVKDIARAYRKSALLVHPDKVGPDNKEAADRFLLLTKAYDLLSDPDRRAPYDALLRARLAQRARFDLLDAGRKKLRSDLEAREEEARKKRRIDADDDLKTRLEIERLREEGLRRLREREEARRAAVDKAREEVAHATPPQPPTMHFSDADLSLSLRFRPRSSAATTPWTPQRLTTLLSRFGSISHIAILPPKESKSKPGKASSDRSDKAKALVVFRTPESCVGALEHLVDGGTGLLDGWTAKWLTGEEPVGIRKWKEAQERAKTAPVPALATPGSAGGANVGLGKNAGKGISTADYESATLAMMMAMAGAGSPGAVALSNGPDSPDGGGTAGENGSVLGKRKADDAGESILVE
ncbi:DnaJ-domain-containing protein [Gonapodya prolifera JEL478]|uniref:DnaJ-domain-containing protein n=1 Tax=Gonapodya prolifera (strain JEL478) TaxID=1344416 RepID=A0A139AQ43_GONPJ|nr:DnaJ-domain-containing protein [Gonapodya prolifera JEL478]|eukprot:KXS18881.1 DnaJ-domain-containing protein [Gonapodya prolifera JEL478]